MFTYLAFSPDSNATLPHSMADIALYLVLFFLVVGLLALFTAWATNFYYRLHLTRMKYTLERRKRLEKLYAEVFSRPLVSTKGRLSVVNEDGTIQQIGEITNFQMHIDPKYLSLPMTDEERDKYLYGSFDADNVVDHPAGISSLKNRDPQ
jgi:hypothetical protein